MSDLKVAIVEDDASARHLITEQLREPDGFRCVGEFGSAEEALDQLPSLHPDVVLMDINLANLSGIDCVRTLKPLMPSTQFLMLTVYSDTTHIFDALSAGATGYLLKKTGKD